MFVNLFAYWFVELPLAYYLAIYRQQGLDGILVSLMISQLLLCLMYLFIIIYLDWDKLSLKCMNRQIEYVNNKTLRHVKSLNLFNHSYEDNGFGTR